MYDAITNTPTPAKPYFGILPHYTKCHFHHVRNFLICIMYNLRGHTFKFFKKAPHNTTSTIVVGGSQNCFECNQLGHFKKDYTKMKNQGGKGRAFMIGAGDACQEPTMVTGTSPINNIYASVLFGTGANIIFISYKFRRMINHKSCKLYESYTVEVVNSHKEIILLILINCLFTLNKPRLP